MTWRIVLFVVGLSLFAAISMRADDGRPPVTSPRATSGDTAVEPKWDERVTITVGNKEGDLIGSTEKVLQAAVDSVARLGGGTVKVLPGTYRLRNSVYLASKVRIVGSGAESVLFKEPSTKTKLTVDSDWYDQEVTLDDASGFRIGDGVVIRTKNPHNGGPTVLKRTLVARSGNRFKLDKALRENVWQGGDPTIATSFPLISGEFVSDCVIENITLDGNREKNDHFDGNYSGCIFLQDCNRMTMRGVEARNNNGDGISWQICHDVVVENCHSHDNADLGLHPGSGSQRPLIRGNRIDAATSASSSAGESSTALQRKIRSKAFARPACRLDIATRTTSSATTSSRTAALLACCSAPNEARHSPVIAIELNVMKSSTAVVMRESVLTFKEVRKPLNWSKTASLNNAVPPNELAFAWEPKPRTSS